MFTSKASLFCRNGKRESEDRFVGERVSKKDEGPRKRSKSRSPHRYSSSFSAKSKSRRHRSISTPRHRSRSRSDSRSPFSRRLGRARPPKRVRRGGSYRSRTGSNRSSASHSRSRYACCCYFLYVSLSIYSGIFIALIGIYYQVDYKKEG